MFLPLQECELLGFYFWLKGRLSSRQRDDLSIVFVSWFTVIFFVLSVLKLVKSNPEGSGVGSTT